MSIQAQIFDLLKKKPQAKVDLLRQFGYYNLWLARNRGIAKVVQNGVIQLGPNAIRPAERTQSFDEFAAKLTKILRESGPMKYSDLEKKLNTTRPRLLRAAHRLKIKIERRGRTTFWSLS
jgi:hypothetical protein